MHPVTNIIKTLWIVLGFIFTGIGVVGIITPMMPGLVFFLIATFCFARGSRKFLRMLLNNKYVGPQISDYRKGRGMSMRTKYSALMVLWAGTLVSAFIMVKVHWVKWAIMITAVAVSIIIMSQKTKTGE
jgi:uncharacterized membrane protein YbaN (DUF454 family)